MSRNLKNNFQSCYLSSQTTSGHVILLKPSCSLTYSSAGLDELQTGIKIARRNNNLRYSDDTTLMAEHEGAQKSLLMRVKEESEKASIQKTKIMASGPITLWQIEEEKVEAVADFLFGGSKITMDGDGSHEIRKTIASWQESCDKPRQCVKKQRHHFANKGPYSQGYRLSSSHLQM